MRKERKRLLYELLRDATQTVLGDKRKGRAAVLAPDPSNPTGEYLKIIAYHNMTEPTLSRTKFYIGDDETRSSEYGTVGITYLKQQVCSGKMIKQGDRWVCDNENYRVFDEKRITPSYDTFINIPIIGPPKGGKANSLGVLCLDSTIPDVFDSRGTQEALQSISRRFAAALSIYEEFIGFQP